MKENNMKKVNLIKAEKAVNELFEKTIQKTNRGNLIISENYVAITTGCEINFKNYIKTSKSKAITSMEFGEDKKTFKDFNLYTIYPKSCVMSLNFPSFF